jgi:Xaa-Pro aminopeptidase
MRRAAEITSAAHIRAMQVCEPGLSEGRLEAELTYEFMKNGARSPAYPCIVGSADNACVLHYVENSALLKDSELVLIDAGCEYEHYAADVTRTFPINGKFNAAQRAVYEVVLAANEAAIAQCKPGNHFNAPHNAAIRTMVSGMLKLGLLEGDIDELIASEEYQDFCPHRTSHWLGIDVHDVGDYRFDDTWRDLEPGMVLTVEPGLYIPRNETTSHVPNKFRGIGVRVEDDVLITKSGCDVLTAGVPKAIDAIEAVMQGSVTGQPSRQTRP